MNSYYVSASRGSDATGAGTALNPWKTIAKAIGSAPSAALGASGARVYIEPGTYYESVTLGLTPTSSAPLEIVGDCDGSAFLVGGLTNPATGIVDWSAWSNDSTIIGGPCLNGSTKSNVTLRRLKMHGGSSDPSCLWITTGKSWSVLDSILAPQTSSTAISIGNTSTPVTSGLSLTVERCDFRHSGTSSGAAIRITAAESTAEYSLASVVRNCRIFGGGSIGLIRGGATSLGSLGTGLDISHCSFFGTAGAALSIYPGVTTALVTPIQIRGCLVSTASGIVAGHSSHVSEDWNVFHSITPRSNVTAGANSSTTVRPTIDWEDGRLVGIPLRPMGGPSSGSPIGGFVGAGASPTTDLMMRSRPEGCSSTRPAAGALERHDTGEMNKQYADQGSAACLALRGPSSLERPILIDQTSTSIQVKTRWDGNHGDTNKPQAVLLANPEIGLLTDWIVTASSTGGAGSTPNDYETLSFPPITPNRPGAVMLRLVSRSSTGTGVAYFDSITLS